MSNVAYCIFYAWRRVFVHNSQDPDYTLLIICDSCLS